MKTELFAIAIMCLAGCGNKFESTVPSTGASDVVNVEPATLQTPAERRLIKEGSVEFETKDWRKTKRQIEAICDSLGAYTADATLSNTSDRISYHQVIRVASTEFDPLMERIEGLTDIVENISIRVDDVTKDYIDLEVRIKNKKEMENRYRQFLTHAKTVEEMLNIERYITDVRTDIERMEAGLKGMQDRIALSTLEVTFYEMNISDYGFYSRLMNSLSNGWQNVQIVIVALANIWPLLVMVPIVIWLLRKFPKSVNRLPADQVKA
jgi:hypothetical protein